jgi:hypothetical protein
MLKGLIVTGPAASATLNIILSSESDNGVVRVLFFVYIPD